MKKIFASMNQCFIGPQIRLISCKSEFWHLRRKNSFHIFKMVIFSKIFDFVISYIIRWSAGKKINPISDHFIKQKFEFKLGCIVFNLSDVTTISDLPKQFLACVHSPSLFNPRPKTTRRHCILCDKNIQQNSLPWLFQCHNQSKVGRQRSDRDHLDCRHRFYFSDVMP